tara:strand:+ start:1713 stop:1928 length:216 start_codon:yes stop_codon:yes gene_type:complete
MRPTDQVLIILQAWLPSRSNEGINTMFKPQTRRRKDTPPLDRLVHLLAKIEVMHYLNEIKEEEQSKEHAEK